MNIVEELKRKLENADSDEIRVLEQTEEPVYWFLLLAEYPEFAPDGMWWFDLRNHCDLPWSKLLAAQPQFGRYCQWEHVSRLELILLAYRAPEIFKRKFPQGRAHDLYAFLTPQEKSDLLAELPEFAEQIDWDEIQAEFETSEWFYLLAAQPQFETYFDWSKVEKQPNNYWDMLLIRQPQFAIHCDFEQLYPNQRRNLLKYRPEIFEI